MPRIRALTSWDGRYQGEVFWASDEDARILCAPDLPGGQRAELYDAETAAAELAADAKPAEQRTEPPARKGRYMRRDMRASE